jgi:hypothetical protein|tara:strand:- start:600 stop:1013 length:414 start_codon:yes stop_codon:yes gene_type:complete
MQTQTTKAGIYVINPHGTDPYITITTDINAEEIAATIVAECKPIGWEHFAAEPTPSEMIERLINSGQAAYYPKDYNASKVIAHSPQHGTKTLWLEVVSAEEHQKIIDEAPRDKDGNILHNGMALGPTTLDIKKKTIN